MADSGARLQFGNDMATTTLQSVFAGRDRELRLLDQMLSDSGGSPAFLVGFAGVGKTALCLAYQHSRRDRYSGSIYCAAARFASADAMLDYIDYERAQVAGQGPYPNTDGRRDTRPLLIVDDVDRFSDPEASYLFTMLHSRSPYLVSLCASRQRFRFLEIAEIPSLELRLGPLPQNDLFALLANYVTAVGGDRDTVGHFLTAFNRHGLRPEYLTPRVVLQLLNSYVHEGDLGRAIAEFASRVSVSNIAIVEHEGRQRALPVSPRPAGGYCRTSADAAICRPIYRHPSPRGHLAQPTGGIRGTAR